MAAVAACNQDNPLPNEPFGSGGGTPAASDASLRTGLEVSTRSAAPGSDIVVNVVAEGDLGAPLLTLQGYVRFDPARLAYKGQQLDGETWVTVNEAKAERGELRALAIRAPKLERTAAAFVFTVKSADYARGLRFDLEEASLHDGEAFVGGGTLALAEARTAAPAAVRMTNDGWLKFLKSKGYADEPSSPSGLMATRKNSVLYGDAVISGSITGADANFIANAAVGNAGFEINNTSGTRDVLLAANVAPDNTPGLGESGDTCRPGATCSAGVETGPGTITGADAGQVALAAAQVPACSSPLTVVCRPIPRGNGVSASGLPTRTISQKAVTGIYTGADCAADAGLCNWKKDTVYIVSGIVQFDSGAVLNIEAGTRVEGNSANNPSALYIRRQGQIFASGTAAAPIVFSCTSAIKSKGCWGGLAIAGNARVNLQQSGAPAAPTNSRNPAGGGLTRFLEGTTAGGAPQMDFGGSNDTDNSGVLRYVIVEYAGFVVGTNNELNGLTLGAVGSGTTLQNIQVHAGLDDGIEFFGGSANARNLLLTANSDDAFDWSFGYTGAAQFVIVQQDSLDAEKGAEGDNNETASADFDNTPITNAPMYNFTWVGTLYPRSTSQRPIPSGNTNNVNDALHIRRGNGSTIVNAIIAGFPAAIDVDDEATCTAPAGGGASVTILGMVSLSNSDTGDPTCASPDAAWLGALGTTDTLGIGAPDGTGAGSIGALVNSQLLRAFDVQTPDFRPVAGSQTATAAVTAPSDGRLQSVSYRGACAPAAAVTSANLCWYMGWTRGWQSSSEP